MLLLWEELSGFDNGHVAVDANACQQEDAAVERQLLDTRDQLAQESAENPIGFVDVDGPEGQREREQQVSKGQVHQVDVCRCSVLVHGVHGKHHQSVPHETKEEHNDVADHNPYAVYIFQGTDTWWVSTFYIAVEAIIVIWCVGLEKKTNFFLK